MACCWPRPSSPESGSRAGMPEKAGIDPDSIWNMGLIVIFSALVGAKILLLFSDFHYYSENFREIFSLSTLRSTGVYYGGLLLALGAAAWYLAKEATARLDGGGSCGSGNRAGTGDRPSGLPVGRLLLRQAYPPAVGNHFHQSICLRQCRRSAQRRRSTRRRSMNRLAHFACFCF